MSYSGGEFTSLYKTIWLFRNHSSISKMKIQLLFVVIFVTLGHSSAVRRRPPACKRTDEGSVDLSGLGALREKAISVKQKAHSPFFDRLLALAARCLFNLGPAVSAENSAVTLKKGIRTDQYGNDYVLAAIPIALRKHCDGIAEARNKAHDCISDAFAQAFAAAELALAANNPKNLAAIEISQSKARASAVELFRLVYNVIRTSVKHTDADTLTAIQTAENCSTVSVIHDINGAFNAIKLFNRAINHGHISVSLIYDIEEHQAKSLTGVRNSINHVCGLLEALYINSCLDNAPGTLSALSAIRYASIRRSHNIKQLVILGFGIIIDQVNKIVCSISDEGEEPFSQIDISLGKIIATLVAEGEYFFEAVLAVCPKDSRKIEKARKDLRIQIEGAVASFYNMIKGSVIETNVPSIADPLAFRSIRYVNILIASIPTSKSWSNKVKADFSSKTKKALSAATDYLQSVRTAMNVFAKIVLASVGSSNKTELADEVSAIHAARRGALHSTLAYVDTTTDALQISLFAGNQCSS